MKHVLTHCFLLALLLLTGASCRPGGAEAEGGKPTLTVTLEPVRYFAEAIAGGRFEVNCMVPAGSSPETYDPTPRQLMELAASRAYLRIGYIGFEQAWMDRLEANAPQMQVFDLSEGVPLIREADHEHEGHRHAGGVEPHLWNSPSNTIPNAAISASNRSPPSPGPARTGPGSLPSPPDPNSTTSGPAGAE